METLELLEEILLDFQGTVLLVSHDRDFMDNVVTSLMVLDGRGNVDERVGSYSDWERSGGRLEKLTEEQPEGEEPSGDPAPAATKEPASPAPSAQPPKPKKLTYKLQRELDQLPARIEQLETQQADLEQRMAAPGFFQEDPNTVRQTTERHAALQTELESAYARWDELEAT